MMMQHTDQHHHDDTGAARDASHAAMAPGHHGQGHDHGAMIADYRRRFWVCLLLTLPILGLSPVIQGFLHLGDRLRFPGADWVSLALASAVFFYGGRPFLIGLGREIGARRPGMMTLIGLAITV